MASRSRRIPRPVTRITGTTASLAGVEKGDPHGEDRVILAHAVAMSTGGLPLLYLGDEVGQLNDYYYRNRPAEADDSRWVHRPHRPEGAPTRPKTIRRPCVRRIFSPHDPADPRPQRNARIRRKRAYSV